MSTLFIASLARSPKNIKCPLLSNRNMYLSNGKSQTYLKSVFKISSTCSNASLKMWMPLQCLTASSTVEMFPLFDQTWFWLGDIINSAAILTLLQLPQDLIIHRAEVRTIGWPELEQWSLVFHELTAAQSHMPCGQKRCPVSKHYFWTSEYTN